MSHFDGDLSIKEQLVKRINTFQKTRGARIEMSSRLKKYSEQWKVVMFILNVEAVIFVLLSISGEAIEIVNRTEIFALAAGVFSIYVILIQYYIGELKYSERSLKLHYHQLDIEDLILKLRKLLMQTNSKENPLSEEELIEQYQNVVYEYQLVMKTNENHDPLDYEKTKNKRNKNKEKEQEQDKDKEQEKENGKEKEKRKEELDFTIDNIVLKFHLVLAILLPVIFFIL